MREIVVKSAEEWRLDELEEKVLQQQYTINFLMRHLGLNDKLNRYKKYIYNKGEDPYFNLEKKPDMPEINPLALLKANISEIEMPKDFEEYKKAKERMMSYIPKPKEEHSVWSLWELDEFVWDDELYELNDVLKYSHKGEVKSLEEAEEWVKNGPKKTIDLKVLKGIEVIGRFHHLMVI